MIEMITFESSSSMEMESMEIHGYFLIVLFGI